MEGWSIKLTRRKALATAGAVVMLSAVALAGVGWYYADQIEDGAFRIDREPEEFDLEIDSVTGDRIGLRHPPGEGNWSRAGEWAVEWNGGFGRLGELLTDKDGVAVRVFTPVDGVPIAGEPARITRDVFQPDPAAAHDLAFREVTFDAPLGKLGGWLVPGNGGSGAWVIHVHGHAGDRVEALRVLPAIERAGAASLVIDYRNDPGAAGDPSGYYQWGRTEWRDLEAAVRFAIEQGAQAVVPYGYSMGGAVVMSFLYNSELAGLVRGAVMDAPMLDLSSGVDLAARERNIPGFVTAAARFVAERRFGVEFDDFDYLRDADRLDVPVLLFHGDSDERVPVETSDQLAAARPDLVTYERFEGGEHVQSWNLDRARYEAALEAFLAGLEPGG